MTERDEPAPHSEPLILPGHVIWNSDKRDRVVGHGAGARSHPSAFFDSSRRGEQSHTWLEKSVGTHTWLEKSQRLREGMGQVTTKWDSSRGQEPGRDDELPPRAR